MEVDGGKGKACISGNGWFHTGIGSGEYRIGLDRSDASFDRCLVTLLLVVLVLVFLLDLLFGFSEARVLQLIECRCALRPGQGTCVRFVDGFGRLGLEEARLGLWLDSAGYRRRHGRYHGRRDG